MPLGGTTTVVLGGTTTLTSLGCDEPPPLLELQAVKASMARLRRTGMIFLGVIGIPTDYVNFNIIGISNVVGAAAYIDD